jgi:eukaryotic-like serine/threonine-protein kinase
MIGQTVGHYRIVDELGSGGMGIVYRAEDLRLRRNVALKFLPRGAASDAQALERFQREAQAASALNHPHICTIHDIDDHESQPFIVMELLEGQTLRERIASKRLALDDVLKLGMQIAEALDAAHARGIVHRDIKSANIFVTTGDRAKILDFGLAKLLAGQAGDPDAVTAMAAPAGALVTGPGQTMGTAAYMSPEQVRGEDLDARTDIFSLGAVLYEMATGTLPFTGATTGAIFDGILNRAPVPASRLNPRVPVELDHILDKALEKDRDLRYQSARELRADLARLRRDTGSGRSATAVVAPPPASRSDRRLMAAAVVGAAAVLAVVSYLTWPSREPPSPAPGAAVPTALTRITFEEGLQTQPTWSPDGRFIAYSSDHGGNFDIWVQPIGGGRAVQVTSDPAHDWQPSWSPDGNSIAFRSERDGGGIYVVPALGGRERRIAAFGYYPEWSPDGSQLLFVVRPPMEVTGEIVSDVYLATLTGAPPARILVETLARFVVVEGIAWHPDGDRLLIFGGISGQGYGLWTVPIPDGQPILWKRDDDVARANYEAGLTFGPGFRVSAAGDAFYVPGVSRGVRNLWRFDLDPRTAQWVGGPHRLTTGIGIDAEVAVSRDGSRLAFVTKTETNRLWSQPFDAVASRITGDAQPVTPRALSVMSFDVSADGERLVYVATRPGKEEIELWSHGSGAASPVLLGEAQWYGMPRVSRDGSRVAYRIFHGQQPRPGGLSWMDLNRGKEHDMPDGVNNPWDWSPDDERLLHDCPEWRGGVGSLCVSPRAATDPAQTQALVADPDHNFWQGRFSPDGHWVLFIAQSRKQAGTSVISVTPATGGAWHPLTEATMWADKPRWAPDGRTIYFISNRQGAFFDVWGLPFDPATGRAAGEEFRLTRFENPGRSLAAAGGTAGAELGVSRTRLVLPLTETTGSVWVLDNIQP